MDTGVWWRVVARVVVGAFGVAALAACIGPGPVETFTPTSTVSFEPTATATPGPLTDEELLELLPTGADLPDVQGAIITAEYFLGLYGYAYQTGDLRAWDALSDATCIFCNSVRSKVVATYDAGSNASGGEVELDANQTRAAFNEEDGYTYVTLQFEIDAIEVTLANGDPGVGSDAGSGAAYFRMALVGDVWRVAEVELVKND